AAQSGAAQPGAALLPAGAAPPRPGPGLPRPRPGSRLPPRADPLRGGSRGLPRPLRGAGPGPGRLLGGVLAALRLAGLVLGVLLQLGEEACGSLQVVHQPVDGHQREPLLGVAEDEQLGAGGDAQVAAGLGRDDDLAPLADRHGAVETPTAGAVGGLALLGCHLITAFQPSTGRFCKAYQADHVRIGPRDAGDLYV